MRLNTHTLLALLVGFLGMESAMAIEEPKYEVHISQAPFELRHYAPTLIAQTIVEGDMDEASNKGFRLIADFIFGNNLAANSEQAAKIAMTAPVTVEPQSSKIAMTAPVTIEPQLGSAQQWRVHFVMPSQYTLETLPKPNNPQVTIKSIPSQKFAVLRFSGLVDEEKMAKRVAELKEWTGNKKLKTLGNPELARYNPPWTLPFLRRNEVMVEIE